MDIKVLGIEVGKSMPGWMKREQSCFANGSSGIGY